ncbi:MAG: ATP-binding protein [Bacteroidetes bacterium]|nr:MAG: ATP-binding protein [Bacteroidota bacterium]
MNDELSRWQENNEHYLAAALTWLRLRLERAANAAISPNETATEVERSGLFGFLERRPSEAEADSRLANGASVSRAEEEAAARMDEVAAADPPPALLIMGQRFGLSRFERETLLLCAAMELDTRIPALCARAQDDPNRTYPTFALALALFDDPAWDVLSPERPLRFWRLIEINQPGALPLTSSALRADEHIVNFLKGLNYLDDQLAPLLVPFDAPAAVDELPASQQTAVNLAARYLGQATNNGSPPVIQLLGLDSLSKQLVAQQVAAAFNLQLYRLPAELLPSQASELETLARLWQRDSILLPIALYLDAHETDGPAQPEGGAPPLHRFLARSHGIFFLATREVRPGLGATTTAVEVDKPTPAEQQAIWAGSLHGKANGSPQLLAGQFNLNTTTIRQIARVTAAVTPENGDHSEQIWDACLVNTRPRMDLLAQRLEPKATWDDIVLPEEVLLLLRQIADQVRGRSIVYDEWGFRQKMNRGLGINALFAGESGTGKTMAAEVLANELRLNLYRIDLSAVVSKYIGETEKNLRRLFDAAEDGGAILFFDEADALFGKRSEVKDSHDRYANIEVNYLLQRMEAYRGLAILATNLRSSLDHAFVRRLRFIVNFAFPNTWQRQVIWQKVFPPQVPLANLDYERLARFNLTGGSIHNIALNAAFLAAQQNTAVTMSLILAAARAEFRKLERPIREADFQ